MRNLVLCLALSSGCAKPEPPTDFGVNLTIQLAPQLHNAFAAARLQVTGDEWFQVDLLPPAFPDGEGRVQYVPKMHDGRLIFSLTLLNGSGAGIGFGVSGWIVIQARQATSAVLGVNPGLPSNIGDGSSCLQDDQCQSGHCVDGVCCNTACEGACMACALSGQIGTCAVVPAGVAPLQGRAACAETAASTCQEDGLCDGQGACRMWPLGSECKPSSCDSVTNQYQASSTCDGMGICQTPVLQTCAPFRCQDERTCASSCSGDDCAEGQTCIEGSCGKKLQGSECSADIECDTGHCVDGVCCNASCQDGCTSCNQPQARGSCTAVPAGQDPRNFCATGSGASATCSPGTCDGTFGSSCMRATSATVCRNATCAADVATAAATCAADGSCPAPQQTNCNPYTCGANACANACTGTCQGNHYCAPNGQCQPRVAFGGSCTSTSQCVTGGTCVDGVCCQTSSCPTCRTCAAGTGQCTQEVRNAPDNTGSTCSGANICDANGACKLVPGATCTQASQCASGACTDGVCCTQTCPQCMNCGGGGQCNIPVSNAADGSGSTCTGSQSCDSGGTCSDLIANGSFESGIAITVGMTVSAWGTAISGWSLLNDIDYIGTGWVASHGARSLDLNGGNSGSPKPGTIRQAIRTEPGRTYDVQFDLAGSPNTIDTKTLRVAAAGGSQDFTFNNAGRTFTNMGWTTQTFTFVATAPLTNLDFSSQYSATNNGPTLDNVRVTAR